MDFSLSEEQKALRKMAREFAEKEFPKYAKDCDLNEKFPHELHRKVAQQGLIGMQIPQAYGGAGLGMVESAIVMEEFARIDGGLGVGVWSADFGSEAVVRLGTEEQKKRWLAPVCSGEEIMGAAISEAGAGSDVAGATCEAKLAGDHYVVNGAKMWITNGTVGRYFVTLVATDPANPKRHERFSLLMIDAQSEGFKANKIHGKLGVRASDTAELQLDHVKVPKENLLGEAGKGFYYVMEFFNNTRIGVAAQAVGIAQGALEQATQYAMDRQAFGQPIASFQMIQQKLAEMATRVEASRQLTYKAAWLNDQGKPNPSASSMAKWFAGETAVHCANEAVQILGGMGYVNEMPAERFYRDAKICEIYEGTKEVHKLIIARSLLGRIKG
ncbi:MAG TPA: acyl-CoA dehydrogenase family protein [Candidatus Thermoplasmatota archaeon]|nr:acyl-CoA dehydrogenase family protein [Candidatus Thermoplasmatota archaeon]